MKRPTTHLAVKDDETTASAVAIMVDALSASMFRATHVLTHRDFCFTTDAFEAACQPHDVEHRKTRPYTPKTIRQVKRFNGRVQREVLGITLDSHADLEIMPCGFNAAYNGRHQRVLDGLWPERGAAPCLEADPALANPIYKTSSSSLINRALRIVADARELSHPDN